ncbi:MAG TPA: right-handed parallel beta-helix repeat-containing protein, partial [Pirellulaceae bacterium]|nr:right-handed parallel beta-helix repeat-containing protein [Pirellulaceae bacterium]
MRFAALLPFALASIHAASARAGVIDVPGDQPTIAAAVSAASNGDTIRLAKGRHQEAVSTTKSLKFVGKPGAIWDGFFAGAQHSQLLATANQVSVRGIEFQNGDEVVTVVGEDAAVLDCTFRSGFYAVRITGARARVASNRILTMQGSDYMIDIVGQNARVEKNVMLDGYYAGIQIDALGLGTALVANNLMDTTQDDLEIVVANANAPKILRNRLRNGFSVDQCIDATNCDDAEVRANRIENVNYGVANGIFVQGARALVASNVLDGIENNTGTLTCIEVAGSNATVTKNLVRDCCGGAAMQTNGVLISGQRGRVEQNRFQGLGGGGNDTTAIWLIGDDGRAVSNVIDRFQDSSTFGVYVTGERAAIVNNRITRLMDSYVIHVGGDDFTI